MKNKIKILTLVHDFGRGGVQRNAQNTSILYKKLHYDCKVMVFKNEGVRETFYKENEIDIFSLKDLKKIQEWNPNVIHYHDIGKLSYEIIPLKKAFPEAIFIETNTFSRPFPQKGIIDIQLHMTEWCLWKYITHPLQKSSLKEEVNLVLPLTCKSDDFYEATHQSVSEYKSSLNIPEESFVFGRIGQKNNSKWSEVILSSFTEFQKQIPDSYLILLGIPPNIKRLLETKYKSMIHKIRVIEYVDSDNELRTIYSLFDVFLHTAWLGESFGLVLVESMLCQTPVITLATPYNDNSQVEVVTHEIGGMVAHSEQQFLNQMFTLYSNRNLRESLGKKGREKCLNEFTEDALKIKYQKLIDTITTYKHGTWKAPLKDMLPSDTNSRHIVTLLKKNGLNDQIVSSFFLLNKERINRLFIHKDAWTFLYRNYKKALFIKHLMV